MMDPAMMRPSIAKLSGIRSPNVLFMYTSYHAKYRFSLLASVIFSGIFPSPAVIEISHWKRDIKDPEQPYSLEELNVVSEDSIEVNAKQSHVDIWVAPGTHATEAAVNKQLNDKERVAAALENSNLVEMVDDCLAPTFG